MLRGKRVSAGALLGLLLVSPPAAGAEDDEADRLSSQPLFEFALGGTAFFGPDYPASEESQLRGIGAPLFIYRGEVLRLGDEQDIVRVVAADGRRFRFDLSVDASFRADSDDNEARAGMPDLDYLGEVGPRLVFKAAKFRLRESVPAWLELELPARAVFATDFTSIEHVGYVVEPGIVLDERRTTLLQDEFRLRLSLVFADAGVMDYFYGVAPRFATTSRPAFDADAGYLGTRTRLTYEKPLGERFKLFLTGEGFLHTGASNRASPLFRDELTGAVSLSAIWTLYASDARVPF